MHANIEWIERQDASIHALMPEPARLDRVRRAMDAAPVGPLHRVLIGVKDIFHVDGLRTSAGSNLPVDALAGPQASSVSSLVGAGAVVLGKTVSTEFAWMEPGPTRNPRHVAHTPGGSSSGSAAAVSAGFCPVALGSQTIGSIIRPAAFCGVVGFKPSFGRIGTDGVIPLAESFDTIGLLGASVDWIERAASVLCHDWEPAGPNRTPTMGVPAGAYLAQASDEGRGVLVGLDARMIPMLDDIAELNLAHRRLLAFEMARHHASWYPRFADLYRPRTRQTIEQGWAILPTEADCIRARRHELRVRIIGAMDAAGIDVLVAPAASGPAPRGLASTGDPSMQLPWTFAGLPILSLPWGQADHGLPLGLQVMARFGEDERLLGWGRVLERGSR